MFEHRMGFDSLKLLNQLQELEHKLLAVPQLMVSLRTAFVGGNQLSVLRTPLEAERELYTMTKITQELAAQVIGKDGLDDDVESLSELFLRCIRVIALAETSAIRVLNAV